MQKKNKRERLVALDEQKQSHLHQAGTLTFVSFHQPITTLISMKCEPCQAFDMHNSKIKKIKIV